MDETNNGWHASMGGMPWTLKKMETAITQLRHRATISFVIGADKVENLVELDRTLFVKRPDLILSLWNKETKALCPDEVLDTVAAMEHVCALKLDLQQPHDLTRLVSMKQLQFLNVISTKKQQSLQFIRHYKQLNYLELHGKFDTLMHLSDCQALQTIVLNCPIEQLDVLKDLPKLQYLTIDSCNVLCSLEAIAYSSVSMLSLSAIRNLRDIQAVGEMENLVFLKLALSKVEKLCNFSKLDKLRQLELNNMKALKDITNLWTAKQLEVLELVEINSVIKATEFAPLVDMPYLQQVDFRFIDFNKGRIAAMQAFMEQAGKKHLLYEHIPEGEIIRSLAIEHLKPILT